jgi:adenosine deaminase
MDPRDTEAQVADPELLAWCAGLPKVELHLHLEGAIPPGTLLELIRKYEPDGEVTDADALARRLRYRDFPHFIEVFLWKQRFLRTGDDYTLIAEAFARDLAAQRIRYAEVFFSPTDAGDPSLTPQQVAAAVRAGLDRVPDVEVALVADLVRDTGPQVAASTLEAVAEVRELGVVGITIGGSEAEFPPELFAPVYDRARELGLRTSAHAGEGAGPASVWGALRALRAERIGHGTRAAEDPELVDHLAATRTPLECCPISNLRTGVVARIDQHPIRDFYDRGLLVTVNTDDPRMFHNSLAEEYALLIGELGFTRDDIRQLIRNAVTVSWLPDDRKAQLTTELEQDPGWSD